MELTENQKALGWKISTAHSWLQKLPLSENMLVCRDCGIVTAIGQFNTAPCHEHIIQEQPKTNEQHVKDSLLPTWQPLSAIAIRAGVSVKIAMPILVKMYNDGEVKCANPRIDGVNRVYCFKKIEYVKVLGVHMPIEEKESTDYPDPLQRNKTGFEGVEPCGNKFRAKVQREGVRITLGIFETAEEANYQRMAYLGAK